MTELLDGLLPAGLLPAGLLLGAAGSLHCVVMCGPLLVALRTGRGDAGRVDAARADAGRPAVGPGDAGQIGDDSDAGELAAVRASGGRSSSPLAAAVGPWQAMALHHGGRLAIYAALGALAGFAGQGMTLAGWSRAVAIASGAVLLLLAWRRARGGRGVGSESRGALSSAIARAPGRLMAPAARLAQRHPRAGRLLLGAINGLLPCGMVYVALTAAVGLGSVPRAVAFMLLFGVGTMPALAVLTMGASRLSAVSRLSGAARGPRWRFAAPVAIALVGLLLIGRGLQSPASHASHVSHASAPAATSAPASHHH